MDLQVTNTSHEVVQPEMDVRSRRAVLILGTVVILAVLETVPLYMPTSWVFLINAALIGILLTASLNLIMGYAGMMSFGQAAFYALGSYTTAVLSLHAGWPPLLSMAVAPFVAAIGAAVIGFFCVRSSGAYFIMLTLAFAQLLYTIIFQSTTITGGDNGLSGIFIKGWLGSPRGIYEFTVVVVLVFLILMRAVINSRFGYILRGIGENNVRAEFLGFPERRYRWYGFIISGFLAGVAGSLFAIYNGSVSPDVAYWTQSAQPFIAIIMGGLSSFVWPLAAGALLTIVSTEAAHYTSYSDFYVGLIALIVGLFLRRGFSGLVKKK